MNSNADKDYIDAKVEGLDARLAAVSGTSDAKFGAVDARFDATDAKLEAIMAKIESAFQRATSQMVKWMVGVLAAGITIVVTVMTFVLNNAIPKAQPSTPVAPASAAVPAVIIQVTPQGVTVQPLTPAAPVAPPVKP